jgi:hypothetical protein
MLQAVKSAGIPVVSNGLGLYYDLSYRQSYPTTGATWFDLASAKNATLNGTYTYYSGDGGYLSDFSLFSTYFPIDTSYSVTGLSGLTMQAVFMYTEGQYDGPKVIASTNSGGNDFGLEVSTDFIRMSSDGGGRQAGTSVTRNVWNFVSGIRDVSTLSLSIRVNGGSRVTNTYGSLSNVNFTNGWMVSRNNTGGVQLRGRIAAVLFYTRALTSDEELQNYNALRLKYGI